MYPCCNVSHDCQSNKLDSYALAHARECEFQKTGDEVLRLIDSCNEIHLLFSIESTGFTITSIEFVAAAKSNAFVVFTNSLKQI